MAKINNKIIKDWLEDKGPEGKAMLSIGARISVSMIDRMASTKGYEHNVRKPIKEAIAKVIGVSEKKIFPDK